MIVDTRECWQNSIMDESLGDLHRLLLLCRRHHRMVHEGGFGLRTQADGQIVFTDPQGRNLPNSGETRFRGNVFTLTTQNTRCGLRITPETGACQWHGEAMDDNHAMLGMLQLE